MAFVRKKTKVYPWPVEIKTPSETKIGEFEVSEFVGKFKRLSRSELSSFEEDSEFKALEKVLVGWDGLTEEDLNEKGGEFGLERTDEGEWTVNEAIDDDVQEKQGMNMARISGAMTGGGWSGEMDMLTAPRGPTELIDEEATPMFDPYQQEDGEQIQQSLHISLQSTNNLGEEVEEELEVEGGEATLSYPQKTKREAEKEAKVKTPLEEPEEPELPPPQPDQPQMA